MALSSARILGSGLFRALQTAGADWWDEGRGLCVGAWQAKGAASQAASYLDLSGNGNNLALGVAPTWASGTGWTFNGTTQWLNSGITPANNSWTQIVLFSSLTNSGIVMGVESGSRAWFRPNIGAVQYGFGATVLSAGAALTGGVLAAYNAANTIYGYRNGVIDGSVASTSGSLTNTVYLGCRNLAGSPQLFAAANIQAAAIYSGTLTAPEVATITAAMNLL